MPKAKVEVLSKEDIDLLNTGRRKPQKKRSVYRIVFKCLQRAYDEGKINQITFDDVNKEVRKLFPLSRFNPYHLAHYKHKFLIEAP